MLVTISVPTILNVRLRVTTTAYALDMMGVGAPLLDGKTIYQTDEKSPGLNVLIDWGKVAHYFIIWQQRMIDPRIGDLRTRGQMDEEREM